MPANTPYNGLIVRKGTGGAGTDEIPLTAATDGLSNTLLVREKQLNPRVPERRLARRPGLDRRVGPERGPVHRVHPKPDRSYGRPENQGWEGYRFGAAHSSGLNGLFGDGAVRHIRHTIDPAQVNWLGHRADGQVVTTNDL